MVKVAIIRMEIAMSCPHSDNPKLTGVNCLDIITKKLETRFNCKLQGDGTESDTERNGSVNIWHGVKIFDKENDSENIQYKIKHRIAVHFYIEEVALQQPKGYVIRTKKLTTIPKYEDCIKIFDEV